ncbi:hypothetical protein BP6252_12389 [Coleophoma cylindrospora]|uniref:ZZ-type domain-containing protein n=1 Tax=Coleophoma cylindrospora TaxID=1849047 RepID=A0A3D8QGN7_9HELO|nr:hypothetical protein BP6252_12389 [Coleophoma cylindrospora]
MASTSANGDTLVTLKINIEGSNRRFKLPLRDLTPAVLPDKLRFLLAIPSTSEAVFERYSDSAAAFVILDPANTSVYKQLFRAAKAKLKLRLRVTVQDNEEENTSAVKEESESERIMPKPATVEDEEPTPASPVEQTSYCTPAPASPAAPAAPIEPEQTTVPPSVAEIQRGFEELLINHPRFSYASARSTSSSGCPYKPSHPKSSEDSSSEVPAYRDAAARDAWFAEFANVCHDRQEALRHNTGAPSPTTGIFSVYCNNCNAAIPDEHYHCSTCDDGDFDLCQSCVSNGVVCNGESHWMIKRFVKNGKVINSTTETIAPKPKAPIAFSESKVTLVAQPEEFAAARTCNSCIQELPEENFVTCTTCDDYDLCIPCHVAMQHGHNPKHAFEPAVEDANLDLLAKTLLAPGRNMSHNAICDGCDQYVYGVRHKCLDCPDWDYCSACIVNSSFIHPGHRFVPIYEPLYDIAAVNRAYINKVRHHGICCDGPLCNANNGVQSYIKGDRYKCAVCHDTDFCANCEASPSNQHNPTHPLIKFKTPVRLASITTMGEHGDGSAMPLMGDRRGRTTSKATETTPPASANAATQVQTVADLEPSEVKAEKVEEKAVEVPAPAPVKADLVAHFVRDTVADGSVLPAKTVFEQTWYLRNGGKASWPAGCSVKFVGGDNMCAVDPEHPTSVHELVSAAESTTCYNEVAPDQEAAFTVLMRTPSKAGNFISYWRLTGPDGNKFGHRLWCDINVEAPKEVKEEPEEEVKEEVKEEVAAEGSQMIFPKLEKESPTTSIHEEAPVSKAQPEVDDFEDFVEESLDGESDDGFLTDSDDYEILEADEYLEAEKAKK